MGFERPAPTFSIRVSGETVEFSMNRPSSTVSPREILKKYKTIAVVGASKNPTKDANSVPQFMKDHGYKIIPINPAADKIVEEKVYPSLADIPANIASTVDIVDVFRPSEELPEVALQVIEMHRRSGRPFVFWAQLGLESEEAKRVLSENKIPYIMNSCLRVVQKSL